MAMTKAQKERDLQHFMKNEETRRAYIEAGQEVKKLLRLKATPEERARLKKLAEKLRSKKR